MRKSEPVATMRPLGGVTNSAVARAETASGAVTAGISSFWAAARMSSTRAARGLSMWVSRMWSRLRAGVGRGGVEEGEEDLRELGDGLVGEAGEDERARAVFRDLSQRGAEGPGSCGVVRDVEQDGRVALRGRNPFETAGPLRVANAPLDCCVGNREAVIRAQLDCCRDGERNVALLVLACERRVDLELSCRRWISDIDCARANPQMY